ncbi:MAG: fibronectin type III domain-containing protein [Saprospiraceae bacterium]|nr:fibronectin type III domain-containing protein [Candidatus Vicinibacter affinis]
MRSIKNLSLLSVCMFFFISSFAQVTDHVFVSAVRAGKSGIISQNVKSAKDASVHFQKFEHALITEDKFESLAKYNLRKANFLSINTQSLEAIRLSRPEAIQISIPTEAGVSLTMDLIRVDLMSEGFKVSTSDGTNEEYVPGVFYQGVIRGSEENSLVALSFFDQEIIGMFSIDQDNFVLQPSKDFPGKLILYNDKDLIKYSEMECLTDHLESVVRDPTPSTEMAAGDCIRVYIECDYALQQNKGGVTNTVNWITSVYNNVKTLYTNESINTTVSEVFVWTTQDSYSKTNSVTALNQFKTARPTFNGDLAHLAALGGQNIGGVAWVDALCTSYKYAYSNISSTYSDVPTYSWTVEVMTHEMGHNIGSNHTQWCGWAGGAIDNCYTTEGGCPPGPAPTNGGTIMSYCHLTSYGINFNNGFGPLPGDKIRSRVAAVTCLGTSCSGGSCNVPTGLQISNITTNSATASWNAVSGANSYTFEYKISTSGTWTVATVTTTSYNMTGLSANSTYNTRVKTNCTSGSSAYSAQVNFTTSSGGSCGTPTNLSVSNITTTTATVSWTAVAGASSYNFQYKLNTSGQWNQVNVTTTSVNMTGMSPATKYDVRVQAVCGSTLGAFTNVVSFTTLASGYCVSKGNNASYEWVKRVKLGTIDRTSGNDGGYYNGTGLTTDVNKGTTYTLNYQAGSTGGSGTLYWKVWIDFNKNNSFTDPGEEVVSQATSSLTLLAKNFTVPSGAATGSTRMRVSLKYAGYATSCQTFAYGEVEDYSINIKAAGTLISGENELKSESPFQVYPNPFTDDLNVDFFAPEDGKYSCKLVDLLGRVIINHPVNAIKGTNSVSLSVEGLQPAAYLIILTDGKTTKQKKVFRID